MNEKILLCLRPDDLDINPDIKICVLTITPRIHELLQTIKAQIDFNRLRYQAGFMMTTIGMPLDVELFDDWQISPTLEEDLDEHYGGMPIEKAPTMDGKSIKPIDYMCELAVCPPSEEEKTKDLLTVSLSIWVSNGQTREKFSSPIQYLSDINREIWFGNQDKPTAPRIIAPEPLIFDRVGDPLLIENFWDCECEKDFIHRKSTQPMCNICGTSHEDQPDSRVNEVIELAADQLTPEEQEKIYAELGKAKVFEQLSEISLCKELSAPLKKVLDYLGDEKEDFIAKNNPEGHIYHEIRTIEELIGNHSILQKG